MGMRQVNRWMWTVGAVALLGGCTLDGVDPRTGKVITEPLVLQDSFDLATEGILEPGAVVFAENPTTLLEAGDFHGYEFDGQAGGVVTITMTGTSCGQPDTVLSLFKPEDANGNRGTSLIENDDAFLTCFLDSQIRQFRLPVTGTYLIVATSFLQQGGGANGHYRLTLACNNNACTPSGSLTFARSRIQQTAIDAQQFSAEDLFEIGDFLFEDVFRVQDGMGNAVVGLPGGGSPRPNFRKFPNNVHFAAFGAPEAQSCVSCHNRGPNGDKDDGAGDNNHNIFQIGDGINRNSGVPRNPPPLLGIGIRQAVAAEMTAELATLVAAGKAQAAQTGANVTVTLRPPTNPVNFGTAIAKPDGTVDVTGRLGIDADLKVRPFGWKGRENTIRRFIEGGFRVHFGMQTEPSVNNHCANPNTTTFGTGANCQDPDNDGVQKEINDGQLSAQAIYLAMLQVPVRIPGANAAAQARINEGEVLFTNGTTATPPGAGCAGCHRRFLTLKVPKWTEKGDTTPTAAGFTINFATDMHEPNVPLNPDGTLTFESWSDMKRREMGVSLSDIKDFNQIGKSIFMTPPLWGVRDSAPYLHDGRAKDLFDATVLHGEGEDAGSIAAFLALTADQQQKIIEFMESLGRSEDL
jgi:mono/diheme cytochrome c family protein